MLIEPKIIVSKVWADMSWGWGGGEGTGRGISHGALWNVSKSQGNHKKTQHPVGHCNIRVKVCHISQLELGFFWWRQLCKAGFSTAVTSSKHCVQSVWKSETDGNGNLILRDVWSWVVSHWSVVRIISESNTNILFSVKTTCITILHDY